MKQNRILSLVLAGALALNLAACGAPSAAPPLPAPCPAKRRSSAASSAAAASSEAAEAAYPPHPDRPGGAESNPRGRARDAGQRLLHFHQPAHRPGAGGPAGGHRGQGGQPAHLRPQRPSAAGPAQRGAPPRSSTWKGAWRWSRIWSSCPSSCRTAPTPWLKWASGPGGQPGGPGPAERGRHLIGEATNTSDRAAALLDFAAGQEERLAQALEGAETPSVYLAGNSDFLSTAGDAMYQADMIRMAGGVNAAAEITDTYWATVSYEQVLAGTLTTSSWRRTPPIRWTTS